MADETEMRRVQCSGNSTFLITLPKRWVDDLKLKNGDQMLIQKISDRTLVIRPVEDGESVIPEEGPYRIRIEGMDPEDVQRTFTGAYLAGYSIFQFEFESDDRNSRDKVRSLLGSVTGMEVMEEDMEFMKVKDLMSSSKFSFQQVIRRMHLITKAMMKDIPEGKEIDSVNPMDLEERYSDIKRFNLMIMKQYTKVLRGEGYYESPSQKIYGYVQLSKCLERICRHSLRVSKNWLLVGDVGPRISKCHTALSRLLDQVIEAFNRKDFDLANDLIEKCLSQEKQIIAMRLELKSSDEDYKSALSKTFILDSMDRIRSYIQDIAEMSINQIFIQEFHKAGIREVPEDGDT